MLLRYSFHRISQAHHFSEKFQSETELKRIDTSPIELRFYQKLVVKASEF